MAVWNTEILYLTSTAVAYTYFQNNSNLLSVL